jgi:hypothetical protein
MFFPAAKKFRDLLGNGFPLTSGAVNLLGLVQQTIIHFGFYGHVHTVLNTLRVLKEITPQDERQEAFSIR